MAHRRAASGDDAEVGPTLGRFAGLNARPVNLDGFSHEDEDAGLVAFAGSHDPDPSIDIDTEGRIVLLDGVPEDRFDIVDAFIAAHGIDTSVALETDGMPDVELARLIVDPSTPRDEVVRLARGATPAKLARIVARLRPVELQMAIAKMRVRRTPSIQAHVTNRLDDPLLLAADAATAVAFGFRESRDDGAGAGETPPPTLSPCSSGRRWAPPAR